MKTSKQLISEHFSKMGKVGGKKSWEARKKKLLSKLKVAVKTEKPKCGK